MERTPRRDEPKVAGRSHAAIPVAVAVVLAGFYFGSYTLLVPASLGILLLISGFSLLSSRINPLSPHFYLTRKPSWSAIGIVFLGALALFADVYYLWKTELGGLTPHL